MTDISETVADAQAPDQVAPRLPKHAYPDGPRSLTGLYHWLSIFFKAYIVITIIYSLIILYLIWFYLPNTGVIFIEGQARIIDPGIVVTTALRLIAFWVSAFMVCRITYRGLRNLHTIGSKKVRMSPGWGVGWYFVPIANLWQPAEGMSQIYHGTYAAMEERSAANSPIPLWWAAWLITNFTANIGTILIRNFSEDIVGIPLLSLELASAFFAIASAFLLMRLLKRVVERQEAFKHGGVMTVFD